MSDNIESYVLLAKQATSRSLQTLVQQVLEAPSIFSFSALLEAPSVQGLKDSEYAGTLTTLQIFSYGTYRDYINLQSSLPALSQAAERKLKQLSLISMGNDSHHIAYEDIKAGLDIKETREVEDLVISATYAGLIKAKLNSKSSQVYIESTVGRDLDPASSLDNILAGLDAWSRTCDDVLQHIAGEIEHIKSEGVRRKKDADDHASAVRDARKNVKQAGNHHGKRRDGQHDEIMSDVNEDEEMHGMSISSSVRPSTRKRKTLMPRR